MAWQIAEGEHLYPALQRRQPRRGAVRGAALPPRLDRPDRRHLTFGRGVHACVGAPLARAELRIAFETLLGRSSAITLSERDDAVVAAGNDMTARVGELYVDIHD